ncbi:MAG: hypothetical protein IJP31_01145 [Lachnospiraceae bacterium]|nr:hypothetical protein [Lachnospiraceae bacterium]
MIRENKILDMRQEGLEEKYSSIYGDHVFIGRQCVEFVMEDIYPPMVRVMLPRQFMDMPATLAKQKYPSEYRPTVIKTSPDLSINFAFQYFEERVPEKELMQGARYFYGTLQKCYPGYDYLDFSQGCRKDDESHKLVWYIYSNPTITDTVVNIHAFTIVEERLLQGIFNAPEMVFAWWKPYALEVFESITSGRTV